MSKLRRVLSGYRSEREEFIAAMTREGVSLEACRAVLRDAMTVQRIALAECNGDWPADNGQRETELCSECACAFAPSALTKAKVCPKCRARARIKRALESFKVEPVFSGDPRGACVKLRVPSGRTDDWGHSGVCVPTRES